MASRKDDRGDVSRHVGGQSMHSEWKGCACPHVVTGCGEDNNPSVAVSIRTHSLRWSVELVRVSSLCQPWGNIVARQLVSYLDYLWFWLVWCHKTILTIGCCSLFLSCFTFDEQFCNWKLNIMDEAGIIERRCAETRDSTIEHPNWSIQLDGDVSKFWNEFM